MFKNNDQGHLKDLNLVSLFWTVVDLFLTPIINQEKTTFLFCFVTERSVTTELTKEQLFSFHYLWKEK